MFDKDNYNCPFCDKDLSARNFQHRPRKMLIETCPHCNEKLSFDAYYGIPLKPMTRKQVVTLLIVILIAYGLLIFIAK